MPFTRASNGCAKRASVPIGAPAIAAADYKTEIEEEPLWPGGCSRDEDAQG